MPCENTIRRPGTDPLKDERNIAICLRDRKIPRYLECNIAIKL